MKILIAEDDQTSQMVMHEFLAEYGNCTVVENGEEAFDAFKVALGRHDPYDLICLDIMMPLQDGHDTLKRIREYEEQVGLWGADAARIIMTTALSDAKSIVTAFQRQCEAYLVKPVTAEAIAQKIAELKLTDRIGHDRGSEESRDFDDDYEYGDADDDL